MKSADASRSICGQVGLARRGGRTDLDNGNGECARCNPTKDLTGWATRVSKGLITTTTPTGHHYISRAPKPPTSASWPASSAPWIPAVEDDIQWRGRGGE